MVSSEYIDSVDHQRGENTVEPTGNDQVDYQHREHEDNGLGALDDRGDKLHWRQIRLLMIASIGFFMDALVATPFELINIYNILFTYLKRDRYDIFIINLIVPMLGYVYYANSTPPNQVITILFLHPGLQTTINIDYCNDRYLVPYRDL